MSVELIWTVGVTGFSLLCLGVLKIALREQLVVQFIGEYLEKLDFNFFHPNSISCLRVYLAGIGLAFYVIGWQNVGIAIYIFASFGDAADGMVAKTCDLITEKGKWLDPLCDKITYLPPIIYFGWERSLPWGWVMAFVFLELFGQFAVRRLLDYRGLSGAANYFGKIKASIAFCFFPYLHLLQSGEKALPNISGELIMVAIVLAAASIIFKFPVVKILKGRSEI
jgi:CDP-diacylglycerol--serine O-phosphatidyltransferase